MKLFRTILLFSLVGCKDTYFNNLDEYRSLKIISELGKIGIVSSRESNKNGTYTVSIDSKDSRKAFDYLTKSRNFKAVVTGNNESKKFISSKDEDKFKYERSISYAIEDTISRINGVLEAKVNLFISNDSPGLELSKTDNKSSASVLLVVENEADISEDSISKLVGSASGINSERVNVLLTREELLIPEYTDIRDEKINEATVNARVFADNFLNRQNLSISVLIILTLFFLINLSVRKQKRHRFFTDCNI